MAAIDVLRRWALAWESDIRARLATVDEGGSGQPTPDWDAYLDEV